jgi:hypothetical protein
MNERIKQLADEAWQYANDNSRDGDDTHGWLYRDKFAELIVQECVAICEDTEGDPSADSRWGRRCCALEIREHFGVEEK